MTDIKLFERWMKQALKNNFFLNVYNDSVIVSDGYTAWKIPKVSDESKLISKMLYRNELIDFAIVDNEIKSNSIKTIQGMFDTEKMKKATDTEFTYLEYKIFDCGDEFIYVDEKLLKNINIDKFECFGNHNDPLVFKNENISFTVCPTLTFGSTKYTLNKGVFAE